MFWPPAAAPNDPMIWVQVNEESNEVDVGIGALNTKGNDGDLDSVVVWLRGDEIYFENGSII
ncbi:hypothetical protein Tco_1127044, partial [Tanacetum coccineum]